MSFQALSHPDIQRGCGKTLVTGFGDQNHLSRRRQNWVRVVQHQCTHPDRNKHRAKRFAAGIQPGKVTTAD